MFSSVQSQSCPTLCDPMDCSMPGLPVHHQLPELAQTHIHSLSLFSFMHWRRKWQPIPMFLPGESQGREPGRLLPMGSHRIGHDWCKLAASAAYPLSQWCHPTIPSSAVSFSHLQSFPVSGSFKWVLSLHQVAKLLESELKHQSLKWIFRVDFL